jgi:hypothetical protein
MTITAEQQAPGCYAAASVYSMDSEVCKGCVASAQCSEASVKRLQEIRELVDVRDLLAKHEAARLKAKEKMMAPRLIPASMSHVPVSQPKAATQPVERKTTKAKVTFGISEKDNAIIAMIGEHSVKYKEQAIILCKTNNLNDMRTMLPRQANPFATGGPAFMRVACDLLLRGGFTKASLKAALIKEFNWTDGTAGSHVAIACAVTWGFKIVKQDVGGAFVLNPDLGRENT